MPPPTKIPLLTLFAMLTWYLIKLIYFAGGETIGSEAKFEERCMMLQADEAGWAREKAVVLARLQEQSMSARFVRVSEVIALTEYEGACLMAPSTLPVSVFVEGRAAR